MLKIIWFLFRLKKILSRIRKNNNPLPISLWWQKRQTNVQLMGHSDIAFLTLIFFVHMVPVVDSWIFIYNFTPYKSVYLVSKKQDLTLRVRIPFKRGVLDTTLYDKVCQWLETSRFLQVLHFPPPIKLTATIYLKYCWKWR